MLVEYAIIVWNAYDSIKNTGRNGRACVACVGSTYVSRERKTKLNSQAIRIFVGNFFVNI